MSGITPAEFLAILPKKNKEDHENDIKVMKQMWEKSKKTNLNPKVDLEEAAAMVKLIQLNK
jgi:hypothetical protein|tara:strand:- start:144 stop:326 length:183 start_codon:yes stop_codon:yes gene_type:complete